MRSVRSSAAFGRSLISQTKRALPQAKAALERPTPAAMRWAARELATAAAGTHDGLPLRLLGELCDDVVEAMAALWEAIERSGMLPPQWQCTTSQLLEKKLGDIRSIGMVVARFAIIGRRRTSVSISPPRQASPLSTLSGRPPSARMLAPPIRRLRQPLCLLLLPSTTASTMASYKRGPENMASPLCYSERRRRCARAPDIWSRGNSLSLRRSPKVA
jgi:hypothetical protein